MSSSYFLNGIDVTGFVSNTSTKKLFPARTKASAQDFISGLCRFRQHIANYIGNFGENLFGFFEVTNKDFPCLCPTGLCTFLQCIKQLGKGFNLGSSILCGLSHIHNGTSLFCGKTLLNKICFTISSSKLLKSFS